MVDGEARPGVYLGYRDAVLPIAGKEMRLLILRKRRKQSSVFKSQGTLSDMLSAMGRGR
jgi:hypothetical protein